jgi:NADH-quinone oxidoreductase subunit N
MVSSQDLILLYVSIEFSSIICYLLAGYLKKDKYSLEAGIKYFLFGAISSAIMLLGIALLFSTSGITNIPDLITSITNSTVNPFILLISSGLFIVGLAYKMAAVPLHLWAPDVYEGAPTPITAYLSVASKAAGAAVFLRVVFWLTPTLGVAEIPWKYILYFLSIASMLLGAMIGILQNNLKRLLAYSSISHIGFAIIGVIAGHGLGDMAFIIYIIGYLFMNIGAFAIVTAMGGVTGGYELKDYTGLIKRYPIMSTLLTVFLISLAGIPPTVGFIAKFFIFSAAIQGKFILLAVVGAISAVISLFMYARIMKVMFLDKPTKTMLEEGRKRIPVPAWVTMALCLIGTLALGIYPRPLVDLAELAVKGLGLG